MLALACGMLFRQGQLILPQLSVLGFADSEFTDRRAERAEAELVCNYLAPDDRVFYVGQGDNGEAGSAPCLTFTRFWWTTPAPLPPTPTPARQR